MTNFPELLEFKENDEVLKISAHLMFRSYHVILYDTKLIAEFRAETDIFVDATFKVCPDVNGVTQMLTVTAKKSNIVSFLSLYFKI